MNVRNVVLAAASASLLLLSGCAQQASSPAMADDSSKVDMQAEKLAMLEEELRKSEREAARLRGELQDAKSMSSEPAAPPMGMSSDLFPPNPRPGECYARVIIPAQYKTTSRTVVKREASERIEVIPAKYAPSTERVLVKPASTRLVEVPAEYRTVTEKVIDKPAHTEWKRGTGRGTGSGVVGYGGAAAQVERYAGNKVLSTRVDDTGEVMCLVEVPATYKTITKQVLVKPASTKVVEIPAEYKTIETMKLVQPATERRIAIPEQTEVVTTTEKVTDEQIEWRPVLCEVNMTAQNVSALQAALSKTGCCKCGPSGNTCPVDGIMGPCTLSAARCYANKNGLPSGDKYVTIEVVRSLGLRF